MIAFQLICHLFPVPVARKAKFEGDILILMNQQLEIMYLNPTAAFIYNHINGKRTILQLSEIMKYEYDISRDIVENDLCNIIRELQWHHLIILAKSQK